MGCGLGQRGFADTFLEDFVQILLVEEGLEALNIKRIFVVVLSCLKIT